jgi:cytochrome c-type biogenesis protein CcmH/NrfF
VLIDECCLARERLDAVEASRARIEAETIEKVVAWHRSEAERHMLRAEKCLDGSLAESEAKRAMHMHIVIASCIERGEWRKEA